MVPVKMGGMKIEIEFMQDEIEVADQFMPQTNVLPPPTKDALQIKAAKYWLKLGEADEALRELEKLPRRTWDSVGVVKIRVAALGMFGAKDEIVVQE